MANKKSSELSGLPSIEIPYQKAEESYGAAVAALLERRSMSRSSEVKAVEPKDISWSLVWKRAGYPPGTTDFRAMASYLAANSQVWLKAIAGTRGSGGKWVDYEELHFTPKPIMTQFEQLARLECNQRLEENRRREARPSARDDDKDHQDVDLPGTLHAWLARHRHDHRLAVVARAAIEQLLDSGE